MKIEKICRNCGKPFVATAPAMIYCGKACRPQKNKPVVIEVGKNYPEKKCPICGKQFMATSNHRKYCLDCQEEGNRIKHQEYDRQKKYRVKRKAKYEIEEINRAALAEGLTYGQYVAKYGI